MLKFFRHNYVIQIVVVVLIAITVWLPVFFRLPDELPTMSMTTPLYFLLAKIVGSSPLALTIITFLVFVFCALFFNTILTSNQLASRNSTFGTLTFILTLSCFPISCENYQFILACPFILVAMQTMYSLLQTENPEQYLFNVGVFVAIASMFYYPSIILILWILFAMIMMKYKSLRLLLVPFSGFFMPYFVMFAISYFNRSMTDFLETYSVGFCGLEFKEISFTPSKMAVSTILFLLLLLSYFKIKLLYDNSINARKRLDMTLLLLLFSIVMMTLQEPMTCNGLIFMTLAIFYALALSLVKKSKIFDVVFVFMMIGFVAIQYLPLLI